MDDRATQKPERKKSMNVGLAVGQSQAGDRPPELEADLQAHIGRRLRAVYDEIAKAPVPERFRKLLDELERKQAENK